jgi:hypothetical protein
MGAGADDFSLQPNADLAIAQMTGSLPSLAIRQNKRLTRAARFEEATELEP